MYIEVVLYSQIIVYNKIRNTNRNTLGNCLQTHPIKDQKMRLYMQLFTVK